MNKAEKINYLQTLDMDSRDVKIAENKMYHCGYYGLLEMNDLLCNLSAIDSLDNYILRTSDNDFVVFETKEAFQSICQNIIKCCINYKNWISKNMNSLNKCATEEEAALISVDDVPALDATI